MSRLARDGTAEPISRDQILRCERGQGNMHFPCSDDHEKGWQSYPIDPCSAMYLCMYGHHIWQSMDRPGKVANPARGQLNRKNGYFPFPVSP